MFEEQHYRDLQRKEAPRSIRGIKWVVSKFSGKRLDFVEKQTKKGAQR